MRDVRVYGNQHGSWVVVSGRLAQKCEAFCHRKGWTMERLLCEAVEWYLDRVEGAYFLEEEYREKMALRG